MKIDVSNGSVYFESGSIESGLDMPTFLRTPAGTSSREVLTSAGWVHLAFSPELGYAATALFKDDRIHQLCLLMTMRSDQSKDWSEKQELERKALHDVWLRAEFGAPPYEYSWGSITSNYDPKGRVSDIIITYAK